MLTLFFVFSLQMLFADIPETIVSGRPGQAIGTGSPGAGVFQIQSGLDMTDFQADQLMSDSNRFDFNNVIRLGITNEFELRSVLTWSDFQSRQNPMISSESGLREFQLGLRYQVRKEGDWLPALGLQTQFRMTEVSSAFRSQQVAPNFRLAAVKTLSQAFSLFGVYDFAFDGNTPIPTHGYVLSLAHSWTPTWGAVYEVYGNERSGSENNYGGVGVWYLMNKDFQWDAYLSYGKNQSIQEVYATVGLSWRTVVFTP